MRNTTRAEPTPQAALVIFLDPVRGVYEVQIHSGSRRAESEAHTLYQRVRPLVDRLHRAARSPVGST